MAFTRWAGRRGASMLAAGLAAAVVVGAAGTAGSATTGKLRVVVKYIDDSGERRPLPDVEVTVEYEYGQPQVACTNSRGVALFRDFQVEFDLWAKVGPSLTEPRCGNADFRNPDNDMTMLAVTYDGLHGVFGMPTYFEVQAEATTKIRMVARTPRAQAKVCGGMWTTWVGTGGDDDYTGGPGVDILNGRAGNDKLRGGAGNDLICGGAGNDVLFGNAGNDILYGEAGRDRVVGGRHADIAVGGPRWDRCTGEKLLECER